MKYLHIYIFISVFSLIPALSFALGAKPTVGPHSYSPLRLEEALLKGRKDLQKTYAALPAPVAEAHLLPLYSYVAPGKPGVQVQIPQLVADFLFDLRRSLRREFSQRDMGAEKLFWNPRFLSGTHKEILARLEKLAGLGESLTAATSLLLLMPDGALFFESPTGQEIRQIFSRIKRDPAAPVDISSLNEMDKLRLQVYLGAILWRARGGGFMKMPETAGRARDYFVLNAFQIFGRFVGRDTKAIARAQHSALNQPWGEFMDMGRTKNQDTEVADLVNMTNRGRAQVWSSLKEVKKLKGQTEIMHAYGLFMGPCYYIGWNEFGSDRYGVNLPPPRKNFLDFGTAWGELCTGASLALGIYESLKLVEFNP